MPYSFNPLSSLGLDQSIPLDSAGKIPSGYLPSYVDDVEEYADLASFPVTGETGKIYVAIDTGFTYRWSGSAYVRINSLDSITGDVNVAADGISSIASGVIVNDDVNASAAIADTKLDTISTAGKVSNSATTATDANTANAIVARDASGDFTAGTITADLTGNADTATALETARDIGGVSFDGTANINLPGVNTAGNQDTSGNAATATKLDSNRTFEVTGDVTGTVSSDLTSGASITTSIASGVIVDGDVNAAAAIAGTKIDPDFGSQTVETTGVFSAAGGAEATPSIAFTGDLDTGIYSPGADQVAISTNGTGALFVDASGNVGVGAGSPVGKLDVNGDIVFGDVNAGVRSSDQTLKLKHWGSVGIDIDADNNDTDTRFFRITKNGETSELLRVTESGRLGLGTSNPDELLHIEGDTAEFKGTNTNPIEATAGTEQIFKFGIEGQRNDVYGPAGSIIFRQDGTSWSSVTPAQKPTRIEFCTQDATDTDQSETPRLVIDRLGNVGIGTTSPSSLLDLSADGPFSIRLERTGASPSVSEIKNEGNLLVFEQNVNGISFETGSTPTEVARIDASGRLLVGTSTTPPAIETLTPGLVRSGSGTAQDDYSVGIYCYRNAGGSGRQTVAPRLYFARSRSGTNNSTGGVVVANEDIGNIRFAADDGTNFITAAEILAEVDGTPGTDDMPGRLVFSVTADGASSPTEAMRIKNSGIINIANTPTYADNAAAKTGGLVDGDVYRTSTGDLKIVYT